MIYNEHYKLRFRFANAIHAAVPTGLAAHAKITNVTELDMRLNKNVRPIMNVRAEFAMHTIQNLAICEILHPIVRTHVISRAKSQRLWTSRDRAQHKYPETVGTKIETAFFEGAGFVHVYGAASLLCPYPHSCKTIVS